jgi:hypothetical protein
MPDMARQHLIAELEHLITNKPAIDSSARTVLSPIF